jgi:hypothetical protein
MWVVPCLNIVFRRACLSAAIAALDENASSGLIARASPIPFADAPVLINCVCNVAALLAASSIVEANAELFLLNAELKN